MHVIGLRMRSNSRCIHKWSSIWSWTNIIILIRGWKSIRTYLRYKLRDVISKKRLIPFQIFNIGLFCAHWKQTKRSNNLIQSAITVLLALAVCFCLSLVWSMLPSADPISQNTEKQQTKSPIAIQNQTFLDVAVDAVVPFGSTCFLKWFVYFNLWDCLRFQRDHYPNRIHHIFAALPIV